MQRQYIGQYLQRCMAEITCLISVLQAALVRVDLHGQLMEALAYGTPAPGLQQVVKAQRCHVVRFSAAQLQYAGSCFQHPA